jgi:hypothetical protein
MDRMRGTVIVAPLNEKRRGTARLLRRWLIANEIEAVPAGCGKSAATGGVGILAESLAHERHTL